ncbi:NLR family CARD domain-containing protein 3-like isoform X2 [Asterias rubens]|uniref:NLR family CARD domain-containing protein 3-like isoform X2 n=1 Tax=Asterias rubens TaxID=7604 RepID=UPI0014555CF3|nr:NLR family CARD domain-containing protein 3-like isoform X2 [Asterias rubens]
MLKITKYCLFLPLFVTTLVSQREILHLSPQFKEADEKEYKQLNVVLVSMHAGVLFRAREMESLRPLQTLADLQDALSAARTDYNHSSAKVVTNKKHIRNSKKMAFKSSFVAKSNHTERSEPVDTKKQLEVDQAVAASNDRESEERHIQIFVSNPVKESLCLQLHPSTTISDLKEIIQERLNIQAKNQHLVTKRGIELCDTQSLIVLGIQQDTNLELRQVAGLMGGTRKRKSGSGQGKTVKIATIRLQDEQETKTSSESKQEDVPESIETIAGMTGSSTCAVQSQKTSPRTGAIPKNTRGRKEQMMKHQSREGLATQQRASTEKQDCLVQSQRTSPRTGAISKNARERKEQMNLQSRERLETPQSVSTEKQDCLVQSRRTSPRTGAIPKNTRGRKEQMKPQSQTTAKPHQSASVQLPEEPKPHQSASVHLPEEPKPHQSASVQLPEEPKPHQSSLVQLPEEPKPHQSASVHLQDKPTCKPHQRTSVHMLEELKPHQNALVHLPEEPILHQSVSSTAGIINEIASNCDCKEIVPTIHQDLATRSQSSDALTLYHHQPQAMVNDMSIGEGSNVFMAPASGITFKKKFIQHVSVTVMPHPNHQAQAIADVTREVLKLVDMTTGAPSNPDSQGQAISDELPEALKQVYMNTGSFVQMLPWVDDDQMHIMDIYTKLVLVEHVDKVGKIVKQKKRMESYGDIFHFKTREGNPIKRVVFSGSAGLGKTTLCDKIAYDWAVGKSEILKRFKLVFVLKMRELKTNSDLIDAVFEQLLDKEAVLRSELKGFIDKNQDKVLILLDGFDEFQTTKLKKSSFGSLLKALNRKQYKECWVVIASRPPLDQLVSSSLVEKPFTHVEVEGFSAEDIEEYVNKFFPDDLENVRKLIEKIQSSEVLSDLAKSPMLLLLMCLLWRESGKLPDTMTRLYNDALKYIFRRKAEDSQDEISQILISIGKVALHGLISTDQCLSFKEKDFDKKAFDAAIRAGVLTSERVFKRLDVHNNVYFIHKTFLEFCAAMYWQSLINTEEFEDILVRVCSASSGYPSPYEYLLRFCCGDNEECTNKVLQKLQKNEDPRLGLICYFESQSKCLPSEDFINAVVRTEIRIDGWNSDCLNAFFQLVKQIVNQTNFQDSAYLSSVNHLSITNCDLQGFGSGLANWCLGGCASLWAPPLKQMNHLKNLSLAHCQLIGEDMAHIAESVSDMPTLIDLDLSGNETLGGSASLWATQLKGMKHLKKLGIAYCKLLRGDMAPIAESMSDMPTLIELDLSGNETLCGCASLWATHLKRMKHLNKLILTYCELKGADMAPIAESVSDMPNLIDLDLAGNVTLGGCASLWGTHLKRMKHLKKLTMAYCKLIGEDVAPIAESMSDMPNLGDLNLRGNEALGGCASLWATHLKSMKHLEKLSLESFRLAGKDLATIAESVSDMPNLIDLDLSYYELGGSASLRATSLKRMKCLKKLTLKGCRLLWNDMAPIAESLSEMPTLIELDLSWNVFLGGCASLWATHLKRMKHLTKLRLTYCKVMGEDVAPIAESVSDMPTLTDLDLSGNETLGGSASLWATHLKRMKHLKKLSLESCRLVLNDIVPIAKSVSDMPTLDLEMSGNKTLGGLRIIVGSSF